MRIPLSLLLMVLHDTCRMGEDLECNRYSTTSCTSWVAIASVPIRFFLSWIFLPVDSKFVPNNRAGSSCPSRDAIYLWVCAVQCSAVRAYDPTNQPTGTPTTTGTRLRNNHHAYGYCKHGHFHLTNP
mmetsp:Transcript_6938/g.20089  ORF Transcript_6938/g.20089 Transcript_6938/m.20089 type:complete len:127 (-) Transcript_6938:156-536(-)